MLFAWVLANTILAAETTAEPAAAPAEDPPADAACCATLVELAPAIRASGDPELARRSVDHVLDGDLPDALRLRAQEVRVSLDRSGSDPFAVSYLMAWQAVGLSAFAPLIVAGTDGDLTGGGLLASGFLGSAAGIGGAAVYARTGKVTRGKVVAIAGTSQLLAFNGMMIGMAAGDDTQPGSTGAAIGGLLGLGLGYGAASLDPQPGPMAGAHTGAIWGGGLAATLMTAHYAWAEDSYTDLLVPALGANLGAAGGYALASATGITRQQVVVANLGGAAGVATLYLFAWSTEDHILWTPTSLAYLLTAGALAGGAGGIIVSGAYDGPIRDRRLREQRKLAWAPSPRILPTADGPRYELALTLSPTCGGARCAR